VPKQHYLRALTKVRAKEPLADSYCLVGLNTKYKGLRSIEQTRRYTKVVFNRELSF
jgi:predicted transcriptional regulator with HTH domain